MRELRFGTLREMLLRKRIPIFVVSFAVRGSVRGLPSPCCDFPAGIASDVEMEAPDRRDIFSRSMFPDPTCGGEALFLLYPFFALVFQTCLIPCFLTVAILGEQRREVFGLFEFPDCGTYFRRRRISSIFHCNRCLSARCPLFSESGWRPFGFHRRARGA